jgi:flagellar biosynthesis GTPase FlhF
MSAAIKELSGCDVLLVDTPGRSQNDAESIVALRSIIDAANPHEIHLVLSSTASERVLLREAEAFADL